MMKNKRVQWIISSFVVMSLIYVAILHMIISQYSHLIAPKNADYLIVLGARVKGTEPSKVLASRIDAAAKYLKENTDTLVIASGGKGPGEDITEAEAIKRELISQGINKSRILLEEHSTDTYENIEFSKKFIPPTAELGLVVTNTFHIYRALSIANYQGLRVKGLSAETPWSAVIKSYSREYLAITKFYLERYIIGFK
ncbi:YdcF family protein [Neobacillus drentensis]|uniref:YdcF family protein n=1 Tax=Neobacillus drentensis TaxID=220684 RepID=UPI001F28FAE2|nr:YdcF family protein [Neobacillus drentensis]ULT59097.1 YdcF family protein [Neobacillus drentensis]